MIRAHGSAASDGATPAAPVSRTLGLRSLRWRLTALIGVVIVVAVGITFFAIYRGTGSELRRQIDSELHADSAAFERGIPTSATDTAAVEDAARAYVNGQPFSRSSHVLFLRIGRRPAITNEPELLSVRPEPGEATRRQQIERTQAEGLLNSPYGYSHVEIGDVGDVRIYARPIRRGDVTAMIGIGEPLASVERAQDGVARTFLLAGSITLVVALLAAYLIAARTSRPLARMARIAQQVDAGDLSPRMVQSGPKDEVRVLAESFDHMLDRLEDAFERQRAFASDASHELRTPLTVIRGQLEVLARLDSPSAEDVHRVERLVRTETVRMQRLLEDLLLLARSEEGGDFLHRRAIELEPFVADLFEGTAATAERRFELSPVPAGTLDADPDRLAQAMRNLIRNAIEHTSEGGLVRLVVTARDGAVSFAVEDDGPGIPPEHRRRVFDRFHRTDSSRTRVGGGTGLGLAIVHAIVRAHGGRLAVGDSPEGGARVEFELPGFSGDSRRDTRAAADVAAASGARERLG